MRQLSVSAVLASVIFLPAVAIAEGLIHQLPKDGAWVRYEVNGKALASDGLIRVNLKGTQTMRSVGRATVNHEQCRWIELETELVFERDGGNPAQFHEIIKLLIPEKYLTKGKNPRDHVLKAYKGPSAKAIRELNLKGNDVLETQSLDEVFHAPLMKTSLLPATTIKTKQQSWTCQGIKGEDATDDTVFRTETRINKQAPFGVVTYKYEKERSRNNQSQGMRTMGWRLVESGQDAKSAAPDAK